MDQLLAILSSLGFNWHVALANFVNFLIIFFVLKHFVFGIVTKKLREREAIIKKGLVQAEEAERHLVHAEEERRQKVREGEQEAETLIREASDKAHDLANDIRKKGEEDALLVLSQAEAHMKSVEERVEKEFAKKAPLLVADLFEKALGQTMTKEQNDAFITRASS